MVDLASHQRQTSRTMEFYEHARAADPRRIDWEITVAFYELVHWVEAVFCVRESDSHQQHSASHSARNKHLLNDPAYRKIQKRFNQFYEASVVARYLSIDAEGFPCFEEYMGEKEANELLNKALPNLRSICDSLIRDATA